jgi:hypothetical protein
MPQCQFPVFCYFCVSEKLQEIFSELDKTKARSPDIHRSFQNTKVEMEPSQRVATPPGAWPGCGPCQPMVWAPWSTSDATPSPIKTPRREKPKIPDHFSRIHCDLPSPLTQDREGPEALPGTLSERGIATGGFFHRHACLRHDE